MLKQDAQKMIDDISVAYADGGIDLTVKSAENINGDRYMNVVECTTGEIIFVVGAVGDGACERFVRDYRAGCKHLIIGDTYGGSGAENDR